MQIDVVAIGAIEHLNYLLVGIEMLPIYQHFFPREYNKEKINFASRGSVIAALHSFSHLVNERLFPVYPFDVVDYDETALMGESMPLRSANFALYDRKYEEEFTPLEKLLHDSQRGDSASFDNYHESLKRLDEICEDLRGPMKFLAMARGIICGCSGNEWIDINDQMMSEAAEYPDWNIKTMEYLAKDYKEAKQLMAKYYKFEALVLARPERLERVKKLLQQSTKRAQRVRVRTSGQPLIEVLA